MDIPNLVLALLGTGITSAALVYSIKTNLDRKRWENLVKIELGGIAGNIELIRKNPQWADKHFKAILEVVLDTTKEMDRKVIGEHTQAGARDVVAAERMLRILRNDVLSLQDGLFGTKEFEKFDIPNENPTYGSEQ